MKTPLYATDEVVLNNPSENARFLPGAISAAQGELEILEECLTWIKPDSIEAISIKRDIDAIRSLPGFKEVA